MPHWILAVSRVLRVWRVASRPPADAAAFLNAPMARMPDLRLPDAANDDLMAPIRDAVERELRRARLLG